MRTKSTRLSGIELLRIIAMCGVVILHYNDGRAFEVVCAGSINQRLLFLLESIFICAVDLFILISGYFLSSTQKRSYLKVVELLFQLIVFRLVLFLASSFLAGNTITVNSIIEQFLPKNYFIILYCALYLISPYINLLFQKLNKKQLLYSLILFLILFSFWNTAIDLLEEVIGKEWVGLSTIGAWGSQQGFNIVNFVLMYFIGGFIRYYEISEKYQKKQVLIIIFILNTLLIFMWACLTDNLVKTELSSAWVYHNPFVILNSVCLFILFSKLKFKSSIVNELAAASFSCFLIHSTILNRVGIDSFAKASWWVMIIHLSVVTVGTYFISWIVYKIYSLITGWLFVLLKKNSFFQTKEYS